MKKIDFIDIDTYIANFPADVQLLLEQVRATIRKAAPDAVEVISYQMPAFKQNGILVWFAAYANHIGFYPAASGIEAFKKEFTGYKWSKGAVQFPVDSPMPLDLISRIVAFRLAENLQKGQPKRR